MLNWIKRKIAAKAPDAATSSADPASRQVGRPQTVKEQGDEHLKAGRYADAERFYRQVMESDAQYPASPRQSGFCTQGARSYSMKRAKFSNVPYALPPMTLTVTTY